MPIERARAALAPVRVPAVLPSIHSQLTGRTLFRLTVERVDVFRRTLAWLAQQAGLTSEERGEESGARRFVPSQLDFSVRSSHGSGDAEGARELDNIREKAQILEDERRDR
jgi:hypothetical protein